MGPSVTRSRIEDGREPPDIEDNFKYTEQAVVDSRQGVVVQLITTYYTGP
jgi:hypothetical protein